MLKDLIILKKKNDKAGNLEIENNAVKKNGGQIKFTLWNANFLQLRYLMII